MHIPDGFIDGPVSAGAAVVAAGGVAVALRRAGQSFDERQAPLAGLVSAFVFAAQMLNFPVATGTSGHLLGGALAVILLGPAVGTVCVTVVSVVQALLFADGGLSALGLNVLNMAFVAGLGAWVVFRGLRRALPARASSVPVASGLAAGVSVVLAAAAFAVEYALGGGGGASVTTVVSAMVGVHTLIGIGEGLITAVTVGAVMASRPDLVFGARDLTARPVAPADAPAAADATGATGAGAIAGDAA